MFKKFEIGHFTFFEGYYTLLKVDPTFLKYFVYFDKNLCISPTILPGPIPCTLNLTILIPLLRIRYENIQHVKRT